MICLMVKIGTTNSALWSFHLILWYQNHPYSFWRSIKKICKHLIICSHYKHIANTLVKLKAQKVDGLCRLFHVRTQIIGYMYICFQTIGDSTSYNQGNRRYKLVSMYKKWRKYYFSCILNCYDLMYGNNWKTCA